MPSIVLLNQKGQEVGNLELAENIFAVEEHQQAVFDTIIAERAAMRQGTQKAKTRSEVSGGGRKPWRQKGTGRARQGSIRAVQWVGGGVAFGPQPRDYSKKMNRKERRLALKSALAVKAADFIILDELKVATPKTKDMLNILTTLKVNDVKTIKSLYEQKLKTIAAYRSMSAYFIKHPVIATVIAVLTTVLGVITGLFFFLSERSFIIIIALSYCSGGIICNSGIISECESPLRSTPV